MLGQPITLITGVPGAGKTLKAIDEAIKLSKGGRKVFFHAVDGILPDKINEIYETETYKLNEFDVKNWDKLAELDTEKQGIVLVLDEAHNFFPTRKPGAPDEWIKKLTEIRHFGIQLILITQDARNIDAFVRRLVGEHLHVTRKAGFAGAMVRTFPSCADDVDDYTARLSSSQSSWLYDKKLYDVYESATLHVIKPKIPKKVLMGIVLVSLCVIGAVFIAFNLKSTVSNFKNPTTQNDGPEGVEKTPFQGLVSSDKETERGKKFIDVNDYIEKHTPLLPSYLNSAPIYHDQLTPKQLPEMFCYIGKKDERGEACKCYSEQFTRIRNIPQEVCRVIVQDGIYNPYKESYKGQSGGQSTTPPLDRPINQKQDINYYPSYLLDEETDPEGGLDNL